MSLRARFQKSVQITGSALSHRFVNALRIWALAKTQLFPFSYSHSNMHIATKKAERQIGSRLPFCCTRGRLSTGSSAMDFSVRQPMILMERCRDFLPNKFSATPIV